VRYIAIDSPESVNPRTSIQCFGPEASRKNAELVEGKSVYLEQDAQHTNRYGHLLRYVWLNDEVLVNEALVSEGFAKVNVYTLNTKYVDRLMAAQEQAQKLGNGMWSQCLYYDSRTPVPTGTVVP
jgi:micrococcal nuclease